jgi:prepilin-type N-terminal cleavage/methylation domain-containing protein
MKFTSHRSKHPHATVRLPSRRGVTLIEMMLVVSILGILMAMVAPRFGSMRLRWQVEAAGQQLVRDLNRARTEAVKRNDMVWVAKTGNTAYTIRYVGDRTLPGEVTFTSGPDTVKFAAFGPAISGAATYQLSLQGVTRNVNVNASGFANVQ